MVCWLRRMAIDSLIWRRLGDDDFGILPFGENDENLVLGKYLDLPQNQPF